MSACIHKILYSIYVQVCLGCQIAKGQIIHIMCAHVLSSPVGVQDMWQVILTTQSKEHAASKQASMDTAIAGAWLIEQWNCTVWFR